MVIALYIIAGLVTGALFTWLWTRTVSGRAYEAGSALVEELRRQLQGKDAEIGRLRGELDNERSSRVEAATKLDAAQKGFEEQKALIDEMKTEMSDTFNALSSAALKSSSDDFLRLASERMGHIVAETKGRLGEHQSAMDGMIKPLHEMLKRYEEQLRSIEEGRHKDYGSLTGQLRALMSTHENLQKETGNLVAALRKPQVRGRWGEMQLRRVAELSGMSMHCDFTEQTTVSTETGRLRPDMVVHLPMGRQVVVDSKVPLDAYLDAAAALTDEERKAKLDRHVQQVRAHMTRLSSKEYWSEFKQSPEFVVLFMPGESFLSAALDVDGTIIEEGAQKRVIVATPTTLIALLKAVAYGWRQEQITKNAQEISALGKELYDRMSKLADHFVKLGSSIRSVNENYNGAVGSLEQRIIPSVRKFKELGATGAEEIPALEQIDKSPRVLRIEPKG
ncbi:MAG: DNA recombination protein RmuC [Deltaproteobacteria bacterium]|nr:DNA recombination protein RmuC [Deltaproteobacteria bacterium]